MLDVISSGAFEWQVIPQLRLTSQLNYKYGKSTNDQYLPQKYTQVGTENRGRGVIGNTENQILFPKHLPITLKCSANMKWAPW